MYWKWSSPTWITSLRPCSKISHPGGSWNEIAAVRTDKSPRWTCRSGFCTLCWKNNRNFLESDLFSRKSRHPEELIFLPRDIIKTISGTPGNLLRNLLKFSNPELVGNSMHRSHSHNLSKLKIRVPELKGEKLFKKWEREKAKERIRDRQQDQTKLKGDPSGSKSTLLPFPVVEPMTLQAQGTSRELLNQILKLCSRTWLSPLCFQGWGQKFHEPDARLI